MKSFGHFFLLCLILFLVAAAVGSASAAEYDWGNPGKAEVEAVLAGLGKSGTGPEHLGAESGVIPSPSGRQPAG